MTVIVWWTFPHSFAGLVSDNINQTSNDSELFRTFTHYLSNDLGLAIGAVKVAVKVYAPTSLSLLSMTLATSPVGSNGKYDQDSY